MQGSRCIVQKPRRAYAGGSVDQVSEQPMRSDPLGRPFTRLHKRAGRAARGNSDSGGAFSRTVQPALSVGPGVLPCTRSVRLLVPDRVVALRLEEQCGGGGRDGHSITDGASVDVGGRAAAARPFRLPGLRLQNRSGPTTELAHRVSWGRRPRQASLWARCRSADRAASLQR
jgi:hypothetical protein